MTRDEALHVCAGRTVVHPANDFAPMRVTEVQDGHRLRWIRIAALGVWVPASEYGLVPATWRHTPGRGWTDAAGAPVDRDTLRALCVPELPLPEALPTGDPAA